MNKQRVLKITYRRNRLLDILEKYSVTPKSIEAMAWYKELDEGRGKAMALSNWISVIRRENPAISDEVEARKLAFVKLLPKSWATG